MEDVFKKMKKMESVYFKKCFFLNKNSSVTFENCFSIQILTFIQR